MLVKFYSKSSPLVMQLQNISIPIPNVFYQVNFVTVLRPIMQFYFTSTVRKIPLRRWGKRYVIVRKGEEQVNDLRFTLRPHNTLYFLFSRGLVLCAPLISVEVPPVSTRTPEHMYELEEKSLTYS